MKLLLLSLLVCAPAHADLTEKEMQQQMKAAKEAAAVAERELPPCEGHDYFDDVVRRLAPPSSCTKARKYFDYYLQQSQKIRDYCRQGSRWVEETLRQPAFCASEAGKLAAHKKLGAFKHGSLPDEKEEDAEASIDDPQLGYYLEDPNQTRPQKGEWARLECAQGVMLAMMFRTKQMGLLKRHFGKADMALDSVCEEGPKGADEYLDFVRKGEDGL